MILRQPNILRGLLLTALLCGAAGADEPSPFHVRPLRDSYLTDGVVTRRAFSDSVAECNRWTVRVLADETEIAFGVIVRSDGYILTKGGRLDGPLACELSSHRILPAVYVAYQPEHDLALLKVDASNLPTVHWQNADDPAVGRWAITPDAQGAPRSVGVISVARREIPEVKVRGVLGVRLDPIRQPAKVLEVLPESAANRAGLQGGDVITRVNEIVVDSSDSLVEEIGKHRPRDTLSLLVTRSGETRTIEATLSQPFGDFLSRIAAQNEMGGRLSDRRTGFPIVLQHDSVLKPEECGGPLVDLSGAAIGINIARAGRTETYAIPDDVVRSVLDDLFSGKYPAPQLKLAGATAETVEVPTSASGGE